MATYVPNATQATEPVESRTVESAALEFRTLKAYTAGLVAEANAAEVSASASASAAAASESNAAASASSAAADAEDIRTNWQDKLDAAAAAAANAGASESSAANSATTATAQAALATEQAGAADASRVVAETARDAAFIAANVYASTAAGLAATTLGQQFQVVTGDEVIRYRYDAGPVATEVARYPTVARVEKLESLGIYAIGAPVALGGYPATRFAPVTGICTRFFADITGTCTIVVRVNGVVVHAALGITGRVTHEISVPIAAESDVVFWIEAGTPTSVWAQLSAGF